MFSFAQIQRCYAHAKVNYTVIVVSALVSQWVSLHAINATIGSILTESDELFMRKYCTSVVGQL